MTQITGITRIARINGMTGLQDLYPFLNKKFKNTNEGLESVFVVFSIT